MANYKKVVQLDYETGEFIDEYDSVSDAAYDNYIDNEDSIRKAIYHRKGFMSKHKLRFKYKEVC